MWNYLLASFDNLTPMNWEVLEPALNFLWQGMLAIFVVIGLIIIVVKLTAYCIAKTEEHKAKKQHNDGENNPS
jgi:heme/copper-type cytochrome/quinol oxidase subunit 2